MTQGRRKCHMVRFPHPVVDLVYVYVRSGGHYESEARRFAESYLKFPPGFDHGTIVMSNLGAPSRQLENLFGKLPGCRVHIHDNTGHDVGAYIAASRISRSEACFFCGANVYFWKRAWLRRLMEAWSKYGPGIYCTSASYEVTPHFNTTGFLCDRLLLANYPFKIVSKEDRYNFEHGRSNLSQNIDAPDASGYKTFWKLCYKAGYPVVLVTWDGEYDWWSWRKPPNVFRKGDQSNMLIRWKHTDMFSKQPASQKPVWTLSSDTLTDATFDIKKKEFA